MENTKFIEQLFYRNRKSFNHFPDKELAEKFADGIFNLLFTSHEGKYDSPNALSREYQRVKDDFSALLFELLRNAKNVEELTQEFFEAVPVIYDELILDAKAILEFDPAAQSIEEVLVAYPGFYATAIYRLAHQLHLQKINILPRLLTEYAHSKTGIDIHPGAKIGSSFFIDHGTGIVVGETAVIGKNVKIYQGVTLGAMNVAKENASSKRHPTIGDNVVIYSGATILGGSTIIGNDSIIGGNVWLTYSVPPFSIVYHKSEIKVRDKNPLPEALNFVI